MSGMQIEQLYVGFLGRPASLWEMNSWQSAHDASHNLDAVRATLSMSFEFQQVVSQGNAYLVNQVYQNLFGRAPEAAGLAYWQAALDQGAVTPADMIESFITGATGSDADALRAKIVAATAFTSMLAVQGDIMTLLPVPPAQTGHDFLLQVTDDASLNTALDNLYEAVVPVVTVAQPFGAAALF